MVKVLITGASGLLGQGLVPTLSSKFDLFLTHRGESPTDMKEVFSLDVTDHAKVNYIIALMRPDFVIHAAAMSNVDDCEKYRAEALKANVQGTENVAKAAENVGASMMYISTNAVFDGLEGPYSEDDDPKPVDYYGITKLEGEKRVTGICTRWSIVRLMTMYGWNRHPSTRLNPATWVIENLKLGKTLNVVTDVFNNLLFNFSAADAIQRIIEREKEGVFHIAGYDCINRFEFALKTARVFGLDVNRLKPVSSNLFPKIRHRPNTCFLTTKMKNELGLEPLSVEDGLRCMKKTV